MAATALAILGAFAAAVLLTGAVRRYALQRSLLDIPGARSSHTAPTPRGGGAAIAAVVLTGTSLAAFLGAVRAELAIALVGGGMLIAVIGWIDDHRDVRALTRFLAHAAAAAWCLAWLGGLPVISLGGAEVELGWAGWLLGCLGIVWGINLFNFMDGIDGIAAGESVSVALIAAAFLMTGGQGGLAVVSLILAAASGGFLVWNWKPARIFMGDVGSGLLGFVFATLAVASENAGALPLVAWCILLGVFIVDATLTLIRRVLRGERWYEAHRSHAYQRAVSHGLAHWHVSGTVLAINVLLGAIVASAAFLPGGLAGAGLVAITFLFAVYLFVERVTPMRPPDSSWRGAGREERTPKEGSPSESNT